MKNKTHKTKIGIIVLLVCSAVFGSVLENGSFEFPVVPEGSNFIEYPVLPGWAINSSTYYVIFKALGFAPVDGINEFYLFGGTATQNVGKIKADTVYNLNFAAGIVEGQTAIYSEVVFLSEYTDQEGTHRDRLAAKNLGDVITAANQFFYGNLKFDSSTYPWVEGRDLLIQIYSGTYLHLDDFKFDSFMENPASGSVLGRVEFEGLTWILPDPKIETDTVTCNVYFGVDPQNMTQIVSNQSVSSYVPVIESNKTYYWRIDVIDPAINGGNPVQGRLMNFQVMDDCTFSKLQPDYFPAAGDLNGDCTVNFKDFSILAQNWMINQ
jgi:hypothetical protein